VSAELSDETVLVTESRLMHVVQVQQDETADARRGRFVDITGMARHVELVPSAGR
jgi:hypothetical protein